MKTMLSHVASLSPAEDSTPCASLKWEKHLPQVRSEIAFRTRFRDFPASRPIRVKSANAFYAAFCACFGKSAVGPRVYLLRLPEGSLRGT